MRRGDKMFKRTTKILSKYLRLWWIMSKNSFLTVFYSKVALSIFLTGKFLRFGFFILFLVFLVKGTDGLAGYSLNQAIFFFLTFNVIDVTSQFLFREVYRFRPQIVSGDFDLTLIKPMSALFRALLGGADVIDLVTIPPLIYAVFYVGNMLHPSAIEIILYIVLILNGILMAAAFHIAVLSLGILTTEIDHTVMIYRDLVSLGRFPVDIYREPLKGILTYMIPVAVMVTLPAKSLMGIIGVSGVLVSILVGALFVFVAIKFWGFALRYYTSASS